MTIAKIKKCSAGPKRVPTSHVKKAKRYARDFHAVKVEITFNDVDDYTFNVYCECGMHRFEDVRCQGQVSKRDYVLSKTEFGSSFWAITE